MAGPKTYIGVGGKARQVKNIYVGVSGKARKVKKAYVGVNGKARLVYSSDWWIPTGLSNANCLAAYRFKGAASESAALSDLSGHGYTLSKSGPAWSAARGFYSNGSGWNQRLMNNTLSAQDIQSIVLRYNNLPTSSIPDTPPSAPGGSNGYATIYLSGGRSNGEVWPGTSLVRTEFPFILKDTSGNVIWAKQKVPAAATLGITIQTAIYLNGSVMASSSVYSGLGRNVYDAYHVYWPIEIYRNCSYECYAAAFYSVKLTAAQQNEVYQGMVQF